MTVIGSRQRNWSELAWPAVGVGPGSDEGGCCPFTTDGVGGCEDGVAVRGPGLAGFPSVTATPFASVLTSGPTSVLVGRAVAGAGNGADAGADGGVGAGAGADEAGARCRSGTTGFGPSKLCWDCADEGDAAIL